MEPDRVRLAASSPAGRRSSRTAVNTARTAKRGKRCCDDPTLAIVDPAFLQNGGGPANFAAEPGAQISLKDPYTGRTRLLTVAATVPIDYFIENGVFYGLAGARTFFGYPLALDRMYVALAPGHGRRPVRGRRAGDVPRERHRSRLRSPRSWTRATR